MIEVRNIRIKVLRDASGNLYGTPPFTFVFSSDNPSCVSFTNEAGTMEFIGNDYYAVTDIHYANEGCISNSIVSCTVTDANGCVDVRTPLTINDPCGITASITNNGDLKFSAVVTGNNGTVTYDWSYDGNIFDEVYSGPSLALKLRDKAEPPTSTLISLIVKDSLGCSTSASYTYAFCFPKILNAGLNLACFGIPECAGSIAGYKKFSLDKITTPCAGQTIDWDTLEIIASANICVIHDGNGKLNFGSSVTTGFTDVVQVRVRTTNGVPSNWASITVTVPTCEIVGKPIGASQKTIELTYDHSVGSEIILPVDERVGGEEVDFSTIQIISNPSFGSATILPDGSIKYTVNDLSTTPTVPDTIKWSIQDKKGNQKVITDTIIRDVVAQPTGNPDTVCLVCNEPSSPVDVLANDTGDIDRSTLTLVSVPNKIVVTKDSNNDLIFIAYFGALLQESILYKVANTQGAFSADTTITAYVACVGDKKEDTVYTRCNPSKTFNLIDSFPGITYHSIIVAETTPGGTTYLGQGGSIVAPSYQVNFTGMAEGTYTFTLTAVNNAACSGKDDVGTITVIHNNDPSINFTSAVDNGNGTSTYNFTHSGIFNKISVTLNGSPATFKSSVLLGDTSGNFTIYNVSGVNTVVIQAVSVCGTTVSDTDNSLNIP